MILLSFNAVGILQENQIPIPNVENISLSTSQNLTFLHVKWMLDKMHPYDLASQNTNLSSEDEAEETSEEIMVWNLY